MSSGGFMTTKQIANKIKAKGLLKIKFYCQMCEKQCRDENGYKCHQTGEAHLRQMAMFRANPEKFMDQYSKEFEAFFMEVMKRKGGCRVKANNVYQEVVADRQHVHMSATKWETLGSFTQYLGRMGLCKVDQTETGEWYVQYIDRDPRVLARQEELAKHAAASLDAEERASEQIRRQLAEAQKAERLAKELGGEELVPEKVEPTELKERTEEEKIVFNMGMKNAAAASTNSSTAAASSSIATAASSTSTPSSLPFVKPATPFSMAMKPTNVFNAFNQPMDETSGSTLTKDNKRKPSALDSLIAENERLKSHDQAQAAKKAKLEPTLTATTAPPPSSSTSTHLDYWLYPDILVRILNKKLLNGKLYRQKGVVLKVHDKYIAELRVQSTDPSIDQTVLQIDQDELETVLPSVGKLVQVVNGKYRGEIGVLLERNDEKGQAQVRIESGALHGKEVDRMDYEDICTLNE